MQNGFSRHDEVVSDVLAQSASHIRLYKTCVVPSWLATSPIITNHSLAMTLSRPYMMSHGQNN
eukprot:4761906-Pleurochrysis_carterae.AAC.3